MSQFLARVELHNAGISSYEVLHKAMSDEGFSTTIKSDQGVKYLLPTAEYWLVGDFTLQQALNKADRAATKTLRKFSLVVALCNSITYKGLEAVRV